MRFGIVNDRPDHPVLADVAALLARRGDVVVIEGFEGSPEQVAAAQALCPADVYLLKSHSPWAIDLASRLEYLGARVINSASVTAQCQDRSLLASGLARANLPTPVTSQPIRLGELVSSGTELPLPVVVKSRFSRRHDLVAKAADRAEFEELAAAWPEEEVIVQRFVDNDGWDHKLWMVGGQAFAAHRPSPLTGDWLAEQRPLPAVGQDTYRPLVEAVGAIFGLQVYGVDIVVTGAGPVVVDVNPFPGARGVAGVADAIASLALDEAHRAAA